MKPQVRAKIVNRHATQAWAGPRAEAVIRAACRDVRERLGYGPPLHFPQAGDYHFAATVEGGAVEEAKGFALVVSTRLPELWFVLGELFVKAGAFHRRERGIKLNLVEATNVHLTRPIRSALRGLI
jgi:hypothetical protein